MDAKPQTPFPTTGYFGPEYFCDREEELSTLIQNIKGGNSTTIVALRRLGKTALVHHLFHKIKSGHTCIYLDILATESLSDLLSQFSSAIAAQFTERSALGKKLWKLLRSFRPVITYDALSGAPLISVKVSSEESKKSISELFNLLEEQSKPVVIAIDEFQQILEYPEKQTDAWLRSLIQRLKNVVFIFSGSQQHLLTELFANPSRPFYRSTQFIKIGKLHEHIYQEFIIRNFKKHSREISKETVTEILEWTDIHTYYVQLICNRVFLSGGKKISSATWKEEASKILKEQEFVFYNYREMLTKPQWELLKAIASERKVFQPTAYDFISTHRLGNPATVLRSLKSLQKMELIYKESTPEGNSYYGIYDILFARWVK